MRDGLAVLIAEDEPLASMALRAQVEALGHSVLAAARDGDETAALARCLPADLAILDMRMPLASGLEAASGFFDDAPTPVILLTGYGASDLPDPMPAPPVFASLTKPVGLDSLRDAVEQAMTRFEEWARERDRTDDVRTRRIARADISRDLHAAADADDTPLQRLALDVTRRARDENRSAAEIAREIAPGGSRTGGT